MIDNRYVDNHHRFADVVIKHCQMWQTRSTHHPNAIKAPAFHVQALVLNAYDSRAVCRLFDPGPRALILALILASPGCERWHSDASTAEVEAQQRRFITTHAFLSGGVTEQVTSRHVVG